MTERWHDRARLTFWRGLELRDHLTALEGRLPEEVVIEDVGVADTEYVLEHALGRVPRGMVIVNQVVPSGTAPVAWYRVEGDGDWTAREVVVRWTVGNAAVVIQLF